MDFRACKENKEARKRSLAVQGMEVAFVKVLHFYILALEAAERAETACGAPPAG